MSRVSMALRSRWEADGVMCVAERERWAAMVAELVEGRSVGRLPDGYGVPVALAAVVVVLETGDLRMRPAGWSYVTRVLAEAEAEVMDYQTRRTDDVRGRALVTELRKLEAWGKARGFVFQRQVAKEAAAWIEARI